jgi:hypothetical protein
MIQFRLVLAALPAALPVPKQHLHCMVAHYSRPLEDRTTSVAPQLESKRVYER